jgi:hypothetical protein
MQDISLSTAYRNREHTTGRRGAHEQSARLRLTANNGKFIMMPMSQRPAEEQFEHDLVVQAAAAQFAGSAKYVIHANPGNEKNAAVGHQHPDIIVTERGSTRVRFIIEVETTNSVEAQEVNHWRTLAGLGPPMYLVTPHLAMPAAQRLCAAAGIKCHFGYYLKDELGRLKIVLKKDPALPAPGPGAPPR